MKTLNKIVHSTLILCALLFASCDNYLTVEPKATIDEDLAMSEPEKMVTAAYARLGDDWYTYPFNLWPYGDVSSDNAMKGGSGTTDTNYHPFEVWSSLTSSSPAASVILANLLHPSVARYKALVPLGTISSASDGIPEKTSE